MPKIVTRGRCLGHIWALAIYHLPNAPTGCWRGSSGDTVSCLGPHLQLTLLFGCVCRRQLDASKEHRMPQREEWASLIYNCPTGFLGRHSILRILISAYFMAGLAG